MRALEGYSDVQWIEPRKEIKYAFCTTYVQTKSRTKQYLFTSFHMVCPALDQNNCLHFPATVSSYGIYTVPW